MGKNKKKHKNEKKRDSEEQYNAQNGTEEEQEQEVDLHDNQEDSGKSKKREYTHSDDSDIEAEPKKKKNKKKPVSVEGTSDKKNKKSIRQMKKERHAQRQADLQAASKDQLKTQCLSYLSQWKHDKTNWKFMKAKQTWLFKNKFSINLVPNESWPLLMEYFESAKGNIRNMLLEDANKVIKQMDDWMESQDKENVEQEEETEESVQSNKPDDAVYKRARDLIQCLEEYNTCFI